MEIDWGVALGTLNLASVIALLTAVHFFYRRQLAALNEQVALLKSLRASEMVKDVQAFRTHYEEKSMLLDEKLEQREVFITAARSRAETAEAALDEVNRSLQISEQEHFNLLRAQADALSAASKSEMANLLYDMRTSLANVYGLLALTKEEVPYSEFVSVVSRSADAMMYSIEQYSTAEASAP